jgi:hypothetical protein
MVPPESNIIPTPPLPIHESAGMAEIRAKAPTLSQAVQGSCVECHKRMAAGPVKCEECHKK